MTDFNVFSTDFNPAPTAPAIPSPWEAPTPAQFTAPQPTAPQPSDGVGGAIIDVEVTAKLAIPLGIIMSGQDRENLTRAAKSVMVFNLVQSLNVSVDATEIRIDFQLPPHLSIEKMLREVQSKLSYVWLITHKEHLFFNNLVVRSHDVAPTL